MGCVCDYCGSTYEDEVWVPPFQCGTCRANFAWHHAHLRGETMLRRLRDDYLAATA